MASPPLALTDNPGLLGRCGGLAWDAARGLYQRAVKQVITFRGIPMAAIRREVDEWLPPGNGVDLALALLREPLAEDKLAGILILWRSHRARPALIAHDRAMATPIRPRRAGAALIDIDEQEPRCRAWT